jgi:hypothetical protein
MAGPVAEFVQGDIIIILGVRESGLRRHLHIITDGGVIGGATANPEIGTGRGYQRLCGLMRQLFGNRSGRGGEAFGQAVALRDIEHGETLEKRNRTNDFGGIINLLVPALILRGKAVRIEDRPPTLTLADAAARCQRLPKGQPILRRITALDYCAP